MELTKEIVLSAVRALIKSYSDDSINHYLLNCPLCKIYFFKEKSCDKCLNLIFEDDLDLIHRPCVNRGTKYSSLNYINRYNNETLSKYWQNVHDLLEVTPEEEILRMSVVMKVKILIIAERYRLPTDR